MNKTRRNQPRAVKSKQRSPDPHAPVWLWGQHAVAAALTNPARTRHRLIASANAARRAGLEDAEILPPGEIGRLLPDGAVHQGLALLSDPLAPASLEDILAGQPRLVCVLDQLSDPHNLGAIFRSAAAFGVGAILLQTRHSPPITGIVAKSAAGGVEWVREVRVVNIARALEALADAGYATIGLAGETDTRLDAALDLPGPHALVLGAEGAGLRPAVAAACTRLAKIPIAPAMESLNVSNAAAIAFHEASRGVFSPD